MFVDTPVQSSDLAFLSAFCGCFENVLGPKQGLAAQSETIGENGEILPARMAVGDTATWYAVIRTRTEDVPSLPEGLSVCAAEITHALCGVWM